MGSNHDNMETAEGGETAALSTQEARAEEQNQESGCAEEEGASAGVLLTPVDVAEAEEAMSPPAVPEDDATPAALGASYPMTERTTTQPIMNSTEEIAANLVADVDSQPSPSVSSQPTASPMGNPSRGRATVRNIVDAPLPARCINPAQEVNSRLDTQVEVRVYPCNNSQSSGKKKYTGFTIKPEGVIIQGSNRSRSSSVDLGAEYAMHVGRKLQRYELSDTRACQLLVTTHGKNFWVVPAPETFSRHSGTCRLLGDRKHPPAPHTLQVGDFLRVGSVGVVVIETHDGIENRVLSEEKIQKIMKDTTNSGGGFLDLPETDGGTFACCSFDPHFDNS